MLAIAIKWTNLDNCMPIGSKDYEVNQLLCGKKFHARMEDLKREVSLKPCLANYVTFPKFYS